MKGTVSRPVLQRQLWTSRQTAYLSTGVNWCYRYRMLTRNTSTFLLQDVEPSRGKTGSHDTSFDNAVANVSG